MRTPQSLTKSDFWFTDGNIVIVAGHAGFKVHRGQLERHSDVFSGLFSIPQPAHDDTVEDGDLIEGCAWVEFFDAPEDVFHFLSALYDGMYFLAPRARDFPALAGVLRLSTKYLVEPLRALCLVHLHRDWPTSLSAWDAREGAATDPSGRYVPRETCAHPVLAITLALEHGISSLLPAALYDLSRYGPSKIMAGASPPASPLESSPLRPQPDHLSREFLCRTLRGREAAQRFIATFLSTKLHGRAQAMGCTGGEMLTRTDFSDGEKQCGLRICAECRDEFAGVVKHAREEVWRLIPEWFGLEKVV
ncbi:hypothetical protein BD779DRAFT_1675193 [Infundibulicybe gibba]|nr:hypothetical protein BD779DRAFT_1675193 [Infundibulicybe gibba]